LWIFFIKNLYSNQLKIVYRISWSLSNSYSANKLLAKMG
jgi:hypothetical protein